MKTKTFRLKKEDIRQLTNDMRICAVSDRVTVDGKPIGIMYRQEPLMPNDSGWRFYSGDESDEYMASLENKILEHINPIANFDPAILPYLDREAGSFLVRIPGTDLFQSITEEEFVEC